MEAVDLTYDIISQQSQTCRIVCPECGPTRKKKHERTLSVEVTHDSIMYQCWHCPLSGKINQAPFYQKFSDAITPQKATVTRIPTCLNNSTTKIINYFAARGCHLKDLEGLPPMTTGRKWYRATNTELDSIGFIYGPKEKPSAIKWRPLEHKYFTQDGSAQIFYGLDLVPDKSKTLIFVEGEPDSIAYGSIGVLALSCPNGAPEKVSERKLAAHEDKKFSFIWDARSEIEAATKIIIGTDDDSSGDALAEEIARRIGVAKCWRVKFPAGCKDASDVLRVHGEDALKETIDKAEPMPMHGVFSADEYIADIKDIYINGHTMGKSTGLECVDDLFTVAAGMLYVVTGLPGSGKSEFIDQIMVNLANSDDWKWAVASFENMPAMHIAKLCEKVIGKPFYEGVTPRMNEMELDDATAFIGDHMVFLDSKDGAVATIDSILDRARQAVMRMGIRGLVIDPYNYIHPEGDKEHMSVSLMLNKVTTFAKTHGVAVFFVAHPKTLMPNHDGNFTIPTGMNISGGITWFAKADLGITVHRGDMGVEIHNWKTRHKWLGQTGMTYLGYDVPTGRYSDRVKPIAGSPLAKMGKRDRFSDLDASDVPF
tara:strand:- start:7221 stop:9008 length:1788 start_codon:yes stop_codon:yes gene_type:complete